MQGLLLQVGSVARTVGPILTTQIFSAYGPQYVWAFEIAILAVSLILVLLCYKRLVPLATIAAMKAGDRIKHKRGDVYKF
jgi:hypothetical protein